MRLGTGSPAAPELHAADDLPDGHNEEQLPGQRLNHRKCLPRVGGRYQVSVPDRGHRDEAEDQVLAERAVSGRAEERHAQVLSGSSRFMPLG